MLLTNSAALATFAGYRRAGSTNSSNGAGWRKSAIGRRYSALRRAANAIDFAVCRPFAAEYVDRRRMRNSAVGRL
jgi:hypothetical protein